jgi:hypothetical protein
LKVSEAIKLLENLKENYGDVRVMLNDPDSWGNKYPAENIEISEHNSETVVEIW